MDVGPADLAFGRVPLRLHVHDVKPERVLTDHAVEAFIAWSAEVLAECFHSAVAHGLQKLEDKVFEEDRGLLQHPLQYLGGDCSVHVLHEGGWLRWGDPTEAAAAPALAASLVAVLS